MAKYRYILLFQDMESLRVTMSEFSQNIHATHFTVGNAVFPPLQPLRKDIFGPLDTYQQSNPFKIGNGYLLSN